MTRWAGFVVLVIFLTGCGGLSKGTVTGKVTMNGKPVSALVTVLAENNQAVSGKTDKEGNYTVNDVPVGKAKVSLADRSDDPGPTGPLTVDPKAPVTAPPSTAAKAVIPKKYNEPTTSGIALTVVSGKNELNIDLK